MGLEGPEHERITKNLKINYKKVLFISISKSNI